MGVPDGAPAQMVSPSISARTQAADGIYFPDVLRRVVAVVLAWQSSLHPGLCVQGGWTTAGGGIGFVNANCPLSPTPACPSGIGFGRASAQRKAGRGRPAVET